MTYRIFASLRYSLTSYRNQPDELTGRESLQEDGRPDGSIALERMAEIDAQLALLNGDQEIGNGMKMVLPQRCKRVQQLGRRMTQLGQILLAIWIDEPVITGKRDA